MSYIINNSRGQIVAVIPDGVINTTATNLAFIGQAVTNYGTAQNENYMYLLENFANGTAPTKPVLGQLWYNANTDTLHSYNSVNTWTAMASQAYVDASLSASLISPSFSGIPTAPTADPGTSTNQVATTSFVNQTIGNFSGNINNATLTGNSTATTAANGTATTQIATTAYVINQLQGSGPIITSGNISAGNISTNGTISAGGNIYAPNFIGNLVGNVSGNISTNGTISAAGNVYAPNFIGNLVGNVSGNISGNISIGGSNTQVVFNDDGTANASAGFTFDKNTNNVNIAGHAVIAGNATVGGNLTVNSIIASSITTTGTTSAFRLPNLTTTQISALSPLNGDMVYNTTINLPQIYQNGSWKNFTISYYS